VMRSDELFCNLMKEEWPGKPAKNYTVTNDL